VTNARPAEPATIGELLRARAAAAPDETGLEHYADGAWVGWSWARYRDGAARAGAGLRAAGIGRADHVVLLVIEVDVAIELLFGAWAVGAVPILIGFPYRMSDPQAFVAELRRTAQRLRAKALVVSDALASFAATEVEAGAESDYGAPDAGAAAAAGPPILTAGTVLDGPDGGEDVWVAVAPHEPALIQLTSGSTGHPRGVVLSHASILHHLAAISAELPPGENPREVTWLPLHHDMGLIGGLLYPLFNAFTVNVLSPLAFRSDPFLWLRTMSDVRATCTPGPPSAYAIATRLAAKAVEQKLDLSALTCAMIGAEPIAPKLLRDFAAAFAPCGFRPEAFFPVYGLAEATVAVTFPTPMVATVVDRVDRLLLERERLAVIAEPGPDALELVGVGRPLAGTELRILRDGEAAGEREEGEIHVRAPSLMDGYLDDPAATAEALDEDGWLRTGDLGYVARGSLFVTGRAKDLIIKGGHNLLPAPIEEIAGAVEGVRAGCVAAVGVASRQRATELLVVVAETKLDEAEHAQLGRRVREALSARGIDADRVVLVAPGTIPRTTSGKVRRREVARTLM
jgi:fatty-acyl-CoA synthase